MREYALFLLVGVLVLAGTGHADDDKPPVPGADGKLAAPTDLASSQSGTTITVTCTPPAGDVTGFVFTFGDDDGEVTQLEDECRFTKTGVESGASYWVTVTAVDANDDEGGTSETFYITAKSVPEPVVDLQLSEDLDTRELVVTWMGDGVTPEGDVNYDVEIGLVQGQQEVHTENTQETEVRFDQYEPKTEYYARVTVSNDIGTSQPVTVTYETKAPPLVPPTINCFTRESDTAVAVDWSNKDNEQDPYYAQHHFKLRWRSDVDEYEEVSVAECRNYDQGDTCQHLVTGLTQNYAYYFEVCVYADNAPHYGAAYCEWSEPVVYKPYSSADKACDPERISDFDNYGNSY